MSTATPATQFLSRATVAFRLVEYDYSPGQEGAALQAAEAIGIAPERLLKSLMVEVAGRPACVVLPADRTLSMKRVAAAFKGKSAQMMDPAKAERLTGFHTGGISPFGQKKRVPVAFEAGALGHEEVAINGGKRGLMVFLSPAEAVAALGAVVAPVVADA
jgi:Cys-tRNA(Pro)/Cys-tRNA(Cys) deacylase